MEKACIFCEQDFRIEEDRYNTCEGALHINCRADFLMTIPENQLARRAALAFSTVFQRSTLRANSPIPYHDHDKKRTPLSAA